MIRHLARVAAVVLLGAGALVACSDDQQACAATTVDPLKPTDQQTYKPPKVNPPKTQRTTSKVQDKPRTNTTTKAGTTRRTTTINPYWKSSTKPTTWGGYNTGSRNWSKPYRKGYEAPQQPVIINMYNHDYRTYPGYTGYYPVGVWPVGYGQRYGCVADNEADPEPTPSPVPTVTVTTTPPPTVTVTVPPSATPTETPR